MSKIKNNIPLHLTLNEKEMKRLKKLGVLIQRGLSCDINGQGIPCRSDRFASVYYMIEYLQIHNFIFKDEEELIDFYKPRSIAELRELYSARNTILKSKGTNE